MNRFIFKKTKRDFKLLQLSRFGKHKKVEPSYLVQKTKLSKTFKKQGTNLKKNLFIWETTD